MPILYKASNVRNLTDARYFAARGAHWIGFPFGPNGLSKETILAIADWVEGPNGVLELDASVPVEEGFVMAAELGLSFVEIQASHIESSLPPLGALTPMLRLELTEAKLKDEHLVVAIPEGVDLIILNLPTWNSDLIPLLKGIAPGNSLLLDAPVPALEVEYLLSQLPEMGFSLAGGAEEKVGFKSYDELDVFLDILDDWD